MKHFQPRVVYQDPNEPRVNSVLRYIYRRVMIRNNGLNGLCTGLTGTGKTYFLIAMGEAWSRYSGIPFNIDEHLFFKIGDFFRAIVAGKTFRRGTFIIFDEPQTQINARTWQSEQNQAMSTLLSTIRSDNLILFFATPFISHLDKQVRHFFHADLKMKRIDFEEKTSTVTPDFIEYSEWKDDYYRHFLDVIYKEPHKTCFSEYDLQEWTLPIPSDDNLVKYEAKKKEFKRIEYANQLRKLEKLEIKNSGIDANEVKRQKSRENTVKVLKIIQEYGENSMKTMELTGLSPGQIASYARFMKRAQEIPQIS